MKKSNKKIIVISIILIFLSGILLPLFMDKFIFSNDFPSSLSNSDWSSFLGGIWGGIIGGIGTLIAIYITTNDTRAVQDENNKQSNILIAKNTLISIIEALSSFIEKNMQIENFISQLKVLSDTHTYNEGKICDIKAELRKSNLSLENKNNLEQELKKYEIKCENQQNDIRSIQGQIIDKINKLSQEIIFLKLTISNVSFSTDLIIQINELEKVYMSIINEQKFTINDFSLKLKNLGNESKKFIEKYEDEFIKQ